MSSTPLRKPDDQAEATQETVATGRHGHRGVLFAMYLSLILVVASVSALKLALPDLAIGL